METDNGAADLLIVGTGPNTIPLAPAVRGQGQQCLAGQRKAACFRESRRGGHPANIVGLGEC